MFSTDFIFRQQKNLVDNQKCQAAMQQHTEVGRAPLIHFQKIFFKKGFYRSKLARELKFYT